jgi:hypothetical protein
VSSSPLSVSLHLSLSLCVSLSSLSLSVSSVSVCHLSNRREKQSAQITNLLRSALLTTINREVDACTVNLQKMALSSAEDMRRDLGMAMEEVSPLPSPPSLDDESRSKKRSSDMDKASVMR